MVPSSVVSSAGSPRSASLRSDASRASATHTASVAEASEVIAVTSPPAPLTSRSDVPRYGSALCRTSGARLATMMGWTPPRILRVYGSIADKGSTPSHAERGLPAEPMLPGPPLRGPQRPQPHGHGPSHRRIPRRYGAPDALGARPLRWRA